ncbi:MAG: hypothetical protein R6V72_21575 [Cyclobacterium sp.]|uniref:hypothetical protein n=1 Tax=Cyclobacterium sp. TaxID=1966343 RepID=UPI003970AB98
MKSEKEKKYTRTKEGFNSVEYFRSIKQKLAERMKDMTLKEQKEFMKKVREGEIKID